MAGSFDSVDHGWLKRMLEHRIADPRILRLIGQWLGAGVMDKGIYAHTVEGTPQGAGISPLLANIFLHYALDLWVGQWWRRQALGRMRLVRYADDFLLTFEQRSDAERMGQALSERLAKFGLQLHEQKTRLIEFGRLAVERHRRCGQGRPETFNFLGFTHYWATTRAGRFMLFRKTQRQRLLAKLKDLPLQMRARMHASLREQHVWLSAVLRGHYAYYGITGNSRSLGRFHYQVIRTWHYVLMRRDGRRRLPWRRFTQLLLLFPLPLPRLVHVWRYQTA